MSRDFILVFGGGMVSLITTLIVLFIADFFYRYERERQTKPATPPQPKIVMQPQPVQAVAAPAPKPAAPVQAEKPVAAPAPVKPVIPPPPSAAPILTEKTPPAPTPVAPVQIEKPVAAPSPFLPPPETITRPSKEDNSV